METLLGLTALAFVAWWFYKSGKRTGSRITHLEIALPGFRLAPRQKSVHENLALAYENLGQRELAEKHRQLAIEKESEMVHTPAHPHNDP